MVTKQMPQKVSFNVYIKLKYLTVEIYLLPTSVPIPRNFSYYFYYYNYYHYYYNYYYYYYYSYYYFSKKG